MFSEKDGMKVFLESVYNQGMSGKWWIHDRRNYPVSMQTSSIVDLAEQFQKSSVRSFPVFDDGEFVVSSVV